MRLIIKGRGMGKTTQMIHTSESTGYPIIVETRSQAQLLIDKAKKMGAAIPEPITMSRIDSAIRSRRIEKVIIDEGHNIIEKALKAYIGCDVAAVTLSDSLKERK